MNWKKKKDTPEAQTPAAAAAGKGPVPFLKKNWKWLVPVLCVAVAGGVFLLRPQQAKPASVDASYTEAAPERRDVTNTLSGTGTLNPANTYTVKSLVDGKVLTGTIEEGNIVEESNVLYTIDSSDASTNFEKAEIAMQQAQRSYDKVVDRQYVRAEVAGVVSSLKVTKGDEVTSGQEVAVIRDSSRMLLTLEFPAADAANFSVGQSAAVTLDGTFEQLDGTVTSVSGTDALSAGNLLTRTVTITVKNAGGLTTAQAATASINGVSSIGSATFAYQAERTLTAQAAGTVTSINVQEGSDVAKDDIILGLSGDDLTESIQSASESLRSAEISMQNLQDTMNNYTITAPISGTIIEKDAKVGDAVKTGGQNQPYNEIGVAGRVRPAQLHTAQVAAGAGQAHQLAAVLAAPAHIQRGFVGAQPGVGIGHRIAESRQLPGVGQDARHEIPGLAVGGQVALKQVFAVPHKRHIYMQAVAALVVQGLGHKAGIQAVAGGNGFDSTFKSV